MRRVKLATFCRLSAAILAALLLLPSCGQEERVIPKEETGEPNTLPPEMLLYREARDTFLRWSEAFGPEHDADGVYSLLSTASRRRLRDQGIGSAEAFASWFEQQSDEGKAPFVYTFSRFDILDIDLQDSIRALITATFLVHLPDRVFETVGTFILKRERNGWVIPFAESGNFESSWWQKDKQFTMRLSEEGLSRITSDSLSLSVKFPVTWDILSSRRTALPNHPGTLPGIALQYVDPAAATTPVAFVRVAVLPTPLPDSLRVPPDSAAHAPLRFLRSEKVTSDNGLAVQGELRWIADPANDRLLLFYSAVDVAQTSYDSFAETFMAIRKSMLTTTEVMR